MDILINTQTHDPNDQTVNMPQLQVMGFWYRNNMMSFSFSFSKAVDTALSKHMFLKVSTRRFGGDHTDFLKAYRQCDCDADCLKSAMSDMQNQLLSMHHLPSVCVPCPGRPAFGCEIHCEM